ncbi:phosphocholine cytidylyltransferase family protein [Planktomarina sp.]|nr:phosphocholine cytidylyltransferase family protein [Planktomarina sp.]
MRVCILGAGLGSRLRPYTNDLPKCMVSFCGRSILKRQLVEFSEAGYHDICVVTGYRAEAVEALNLTTIHNTKFSDTNMVYSLMLAKQHLEGSDLLISYADIVFDQTVLSALRNVADDFAVVVDRRWHALWSERMENPLDDAESMIIENDCIVSLGEKTYDVNEIQGQFIGIVKMSSGGFKIACELWERLNVDATQGLNIHNMFMTDFIQRLINEGHKVRPIYVNNGWIEIDTVKDLKVYEHLHQVGRLEEFVKIRNGI